MATFPTPGNDELDGYATVYGLGGDDELTVGDGGNNYAFGDSRFATTYSGDIIGGNDEITFGDTAVRLTERCWL